MKRTVFGILIMTLGIMLFAAGTTLFAVSAQNVQEDADGHISQTVSEVYEGEYYRDGDVSSEKIVITDDTLIFSDGTSAGYVLNVWKNIPDTDEVSGKITYKDYCFLKLDGRKLSYDPKNRTVTIDGVTYVMV